MIRRAMSSEIYDRVAGDRDEGARVQWHHFGMAHWPDHCRAFGQDAGENIAGEFFAVEVIQQCRGMCLDQGRGQPLVKFFGIMPACES